MTKIKLRRSNQKSKGWELHCLSQHMQKNDNEIVKFFTILSVLCHYFTSWCPALSTPLLSFYVCAFIRILFLKSRHKRPRHSPETCHTCLTTMRVWWSVLHRYFIGFIGILSVLRTGCAEPSPSLRLHIYYNICRLTKNPACEVIDDTDVHRKTYYESIPAAS